ncbi:anti-sigma factor family protein [Iningainema tapete]|uniref:Zf-HC2 domain-containing protein n=1 Tax=Iningainema tapete BLCC-T55 TaxID=2748662 RepID=A0A8J6XQ15_9CYAN|nr:zf-HC2 domain-containing protein [Iningainema tapete]MBD2776089.1 zf-HC2 domain-containing protein [Iningainema tapete BLCC-T55]
MTTDSQSQDYSHSQDNLELPSGNDRHTNELTGAMDMVKRDRFELLSAYLDGEVTAAERKQVEEWLATDPTAKHLYARLLKLRHSVRNIPVPETVPVEKTVEQVLTRLHRRAQLKWLCGGAAVAACVISAVSGLLPTPELQIADKQSVKQAQTASTPATTSPLMVAINNPVIPIPKAAQAAPESGVDQFKDIENDIN